MSVPCLTACGAETSRSLNYLFRHWRSRGRSQVCSAPSTTASPSCAKPTPRSKPSPRRCSSRGLSISTPCAPRWKAAPPKAWTRPRRRCFRMGSRRRSWGRCRGGGKSKHWGRFAATSTEGYRPSTLKPTVCWYSIKNAFVISPLITARGAGTTPRSEKSMAEKLLLVMFW